MSTPKDPRIIGTNSRHSGTLRGRNPWSVIPAKHVLDLIGEQESMVFIDSRLHASLDPYGE